MRKLTPWLAVLALSACSGSNQPSPSGVVGPGLPLSDSGQPRDAARPGVIRQGNCTLTQGFWKNHAGAWPVEELVLGGVTYTKAEAIAILRTPPRGDATYILIHQLIATKLNVAAGADPSAIATVIADADAWLASHPLGSKPTGADRETGIMLAGLLDDFNNGVTGPGHCGEPTPSPTPTPTPTPSPTPPPG
jgi:hypothetical protein